MSDVYRITGLMSGSSMDGVDLAFCQFSREKGIWRHQIIHAETTPYPIALRESLQMAHTWPLERIGSLDMELGYYFAERIKEFHASNYIQTDLVSSHGHTILHQPDKGITLQIGNGSIMSRETGLKVIHNFRAEDVAQGGQGAPLVPVGDRWLFGGYDACLNLGGIANISFENWAQERIAYDICPVNMALNWLAGLKGLTYDEGGNLARSGVIDPLLLDQLNQLSYYLMQPPKSMGREWFSEGFLPLLKKTKLNVTDRMATVVEHISFQIARETKLNNLRSILITGGGTMNHYLVKRLKLHTGIDLEIPASEIVHFKEALVFAFLGLLRIRNEINCLASVTGGKRDLSTGEISLPK